MILFIPLHMLLWLTEEENFLGYIYPISGKGVITSAGTFVSCIKFDTVISMQYINVINVILMQYICVEGI